MLNCSIIEFQLDRKLVEVAGSLQQFVDDPSAVFAASRATEKVPQEPTQFWVIRHKIVKPESAYISIEAFSFWIERILKKS